MRNILWNDDLKDWDGSSYYTYAYNENGVLITFVSYGGDMENRVWIVYITNHWYWHGISVSNILNHRDNNILIFSQNKVIVI